MSETKRQRVAAVQMEPKLGKVAENLEIILSRLAEAAKGEANLVVFPECALSGYGFDSRDQGLAAAVSTAGPELEAVARVCADLGVHCVLGLLERDGDKLFNAAALVGPAGLVGVYRKVHLPYLGVDMFVDPGDRPFAVHDAGGIRIGMHICYDASFPEAGRALTLLGADLLVLPTNWPTHSEPTAEHVIPARAIENTVYVMAVNRVGLESGFQFIGHSSIVDPFGKVLAVGSADREEILYADIDVNRARRKHLVRVPGRHEINRIGDRRPGFYQPLVAPNGRD
jgi:predicted amidohydrolase